jgi:ectoine hydroxylase-related dioxygenase (phytanoyl-CoA dioxygenase family)
VCTSQIHIYIFHIDFFFLTFNFFKFKNCEKVITVWIALDDMDVELGPLQYCPGSHLWEDKGERQNGSISHFFGLRDHRWPMWEAAKVEVSVVIHRGLQ